MIFNLKCKNNMHNERDNHHGLLHCCVGRRLLQDSQYNVDDNAEDMDSATFNLDHQLDYDHRNMQLEGEFKSFVLEILVILLVLFIVALIATATIWLLSMHILKSVQTKDNKGQPCIVSHL